MSDMLVLASANTYAASLGHLLDAHAVLQELYRGNEALSAYSRMNTRLSLVTPEGTALTLAGGRALSADLALSAFAEARLIYLPAYEAGRSEDAGLAPSEDPAVSDWLRLHYGRGAVVAASGASVWRLAQAGLLTGAKAAVEPRLAPAFRRAFPRVELEPLQMINTTGRAMTCGSAAAEREFVIRVIAHALSPGVAELLALRWGGAGDAEISLPRDPLVARAQLWIRERFTDSFRIQTLAEILSVSHQTLIRRFRLATGLTPRDYAQGLRIQAASLMLRETTRTVAEVSALVGYSDLPTFRTVFRDRTGLTPAAYRAAHRSSAEGLNLPPPNSSQRPWSGGPRDGQ